MEKINSERITLESSRKSIQSKNQRHKLIISVPIVVTAAISLITCYMMMINRINLDLATIIIVISIIGLMLVLSLMDRLGI